MVLAAISFTNESVASPLAVGAVDRVDLKTSSVVVLGQQFPVGAGTLVTTEASYPRPVSLADVPQNALVWVEGEEKTSGAVSVAAVIVLPETYVAGASQLSLTGVVSGISSDGQIRIGTLKVDITQTLGSNSAPVAVGDLVKLTGTQPAAQGVLLAQSLVRADGVGGTGKVETLGVGGTGRVATLGVGGTGKVETLGVGGTGRVATLGVGGTGNVTTLGVGGTGKVATLGVGGTGKVTALGVGGTGR
jgi:hypothetical protein